MEKDKQNASEWLTYDCGKIANIGQFLKQELDANPAEKYFDAQDEGNKSVILN